MGVAQTFDWQLCNACTAPHITSQPKHLGKWIAVIGDMIVAFGADIRTVYSKSKTEHSTEIPLIMKIPKETIMLL